MADSTATLELRILGADKAAAEVGKFEQKTTRSMTAAEQSVAKSLGSMVAQYASMAVAVQKTMKVLSSGVEFNKFVENTTMSFSVMMKSAEKAKSQMKDLYDFAVNSPLTFKETASSAKQLMAYGFAAKELVPTMKSLGSVAVATGHSLDDISYIYGTLKSQGRAYSRDLMQFGMRGIPIYEELAKVLGVGTDKIQKMASEGKIGFKEVEKAFQNMTTNGGRFAGILEGYMQTLTGKMSMLSDIWQRMTGVLMGATMPVIKSFVDKLTVALSSAKFEKVMKDIGAQIAVVIKGLTGMILFVIDNLPMVLNILETIVALKVGNEIKNIATAAMSLTGALGPASLGIAAALMVAISLRNELASIYRESNEAGRVSKSMATRVSQLGFDYDPTRQAGATKVIGNSLTQPFTGKDNISNQVNPADVASIAESYGITAAKAAETLISIKALSAAQWKFYLDTKSANLGVEELQKRLAAIAGIKTDKQYQLEFLSGLTGNVAENYDDKTTIAMGTRGAKDYIKSFSDKMEADKDLYREAFTPDMKKANLQDEVKALYASLAAGANVPNLFEKTGFDETTIARIVQINEELEGTKKLQKSWTDREWMAKVTNTQLDDILLVRDKALYAAKQELDAKVINAEEFARINKNIQLSYQKDIEKEKSKIMLNGDAQYFDDMKAKAAGIIQFGANAGLYGGMAGGASIQGAAQLTQGSEIGTAMSNSSGFSADAFSGMATAMAAFLSSIENVNKVLNPFTTIIEAMRSTMEPLINNVLQPVVDMLEMFGEVIGQVLMPFMAMIKMVTSIVYIALTPLMAVLQAVGAVFQWLYDKIIVPIANKMIKIFNAIIKVINKLPGVHIRYIDALEKTSDMLEDKAAAEQKYKDAIESLADAIGAVADKMLTYLDSTISAFATKINSSIDDTIDSLQDLYEVGAITGADYMSQVSGLNAGRVDVDEQMLSYADQQLLALGTTGDLYKRLGELVAVKNAINDSPTMTSKAIIEALSAAGILTPSQIADQQSATLALAIATGFADWSGSATAVAEAQARLDNLIAHQSASTAIMDAAVEMSLAAKTITDIETKRAGDIKDAEKVNPATPVASTPTGQTTGPKTETVPVAVKSIADRIKAYLSSNKFLSAQSSAAQLGGQAISGFQQYINQQLYASNGAYADTYLKSQGFAVGTPNVPYDMNTTVHEGEGVIPKTFMQGIRSGELSLSGKKGSSNGSTTVIVNVSGSVTTERDLVTAVAKGIYTQRSRGLLTV